MKKILLAAINARFTHSCLALYCLKAYAQGLDYEIVIREFSINQDVGSIIDEIISESPDAVGLSVYIWNSRMVKEIIPAIKSRSDGMRIILGGPEVSFNSGSWLSDFPEIDYIVTGGGEQGFRNLLTHGLGLPRGIISAENPPFEHVPFPYTTRDLAALQKKYVYYEASRGCPFRCSYCLSSRSDQNPEVKSLETVRGELALILERAPRLVKFVDRTFNVRGGHHRGIWKFLLENPRAGPVAFHFEIHPFYLDDEDFAILSVCPENLFQFEIGVQSIHERTRAAVGRTGDWAREKDAIRRLLDLKTVRIHLDLIVGLPREDLGAVKQGINELMMLQPGHLQIGFLKVLPGTDMRTRAGEYGLVYEDDPPYQVRENRWLGREEIMLLEKIAYLTDRLYNTGRFSLSLSRLAALYESPFELLRDMALFGDSFGRPVTRGWEAGASFIQKFIASRFADKRVFFLDALRWDWGASSATHRYPDTIRPDKAVEIKKAGFAFFKKLAEHGRVKYGGADFTLSDLKRSIFFKAESDEFRREYMNDNPYALFLPDRRGVVFYRR